MIVKSAMNLLWSARRKHCALGAFNVFNVELVQATVAAAAARNASVILATEEHDLQYCPPEIMAEIVSRAASGAKTSVILHLDHCTDIELVARCLEAGYVSVMFDGSRLPLEENIAQTRTVVEMARSYGVPVEGELGVILKARDKKRSEYQAHGVTDPRAAEEFVKRTGVQLLAPAVGTAHGVYKELPEIDFDILEEIAERTQIPLVLHGGSGVPVEDVRRCVQLGVAKVNVGTDLRRTFVDRISEGASDGSYIEATEVLASARSSVEKVVGRWIDELESVKLFQ